MKQSKDQKSTIRLSRGQRSHVRHPGWCPRAGKEERALQLPVSRQVSVPPARHGPEALLRLFLRPPRSETPFSAIQRPPFFAILRPARISCWTVNSNGGIGCALGLHLRFSRLERLLPRQSSSAESRRFRARANPQGSRGRRKEAEFHRNLAGDEHGQLGSSGP